MRFQKIIGDVLVILSKAKNLREGGVFLERFFALLRMTWIGTPFLLTGVRQNFVFPGAFPTQA